MPSEPSGKPSWRRHKNLAPPLSRRNFSTDDLLGFIFAIQTDLRGCRPSQLDEP